MASSCTSFTHDVFLSFFGADTPYRVTDTLCKSLSNKGINTFIDDHLSNKEFNTFIADHKETESSHSLINVINHSRFAIIVFTENYAFSSCCLEVLSSTVDNFQQNHKNRCIIPVFYDMDPSHVRKQSGTYEIAFAKHEERLKENKQKVVKWRNTLSQVANFSGFYFQHGMEEFEDDFIHKIVKAVSRKFDHVLLHISDYPVGLDSRLGEVYPYLELESHQVLAVGIYGIGGLGKTTFARAVYNMIADQFEASCFLSNIRKSSNTQSLAHLQNILLSEMTGLKDIHIRDTSKGVSEIKHRLHQKKVLLILDDVDKLEQMEALAGGLDWFGPGSRVVITTRDRHLLAFRGVERRYEVQELNDVDALDLLSHKDFKQGIVDPNYTELLNRAVTYTSGLPLALEVIGSSLFGLSVDQCEHALNQFKRILPKDIQKLLRVSFDALDQEVKNIFLDITCCFKGYALADVEDMATI